MKKQLSEAQAARLERKKKIRKRRLIISTLLLLCIGIIAFVILLKVKLFPVKNVSAKGSSIYSSEQIVNASGITDETPIMGFSYSKTSNRILKKLPYIESVKISRTLPDTVTLKVSDAKECYAFNNGKSYYAVSKKGKVLNKYGEPPQNLIEVLSNDTVLKIGEDIKFKDSKSREFFDILSTYPEEKGIKVNSIDITSSVHLVIGVEDRFEVNLGTEANLKEKIDHLAGMISEIGDRRGKINLEMWSNSDSKGTFIAEN